MAIFLPFLKGCPAVGCVADDPCTEDEWFEVQIGLGSGTPFRHYQGISASNPAIFTGTDLGYRDLFPTVGEGECSIPTAGSIYADVDLVGDGAYGPVFINAGQLRAAGLLPASFPIYVAAYDPSPDPCSFRVNVFDDTATLAFFQNIPVTSVTSMSCGSVPMVGTLTVDWDGTDYVWSYA